MKIVKVTPLGKKRVFSPEMASSHHNYITGNAPVVHKNSHAVAYCLVALRCLWLKAHFAPEWWAAVMSDCHPDKLVRYMGVARGESWKPTEITDSGSKIDTKRTLTFDTVNINDLTNSFTVSGNTIMQGIVSIKGIGERAAQVYGGKNDCKSIDDFLAVEGRKNKTAMERFIKLGAFKHLPGHENAQALWNYYAFHHTSDSKFKTKLKETLLEHQGWNDVSIREERLRQIKEYRSLYPKRLRIPDKLQNWKPVPATKLQNFVACFPDFTKDEKLEFQKQYLGFYVDSPLSVYKVTGTKTIAEAKRRGGGVESLLEVILIDAVDATSKNDKPYKKLVVSDGISNAVIMVWSRECKLQSKEVLTPGHGVQLAVTYDPERHTFVLARGEVIVKLQRRED